MRLHPFKYAENDWRSAAGIAEDAIAGTNYLIKWALRLIGDLGRKRVESPGYTGGVDEKKILRPVRCKLGVGWKRLSGVRRSAN